VGKLSRYFFNWSLVDDVITSNVVGKLIFWPKTLPFFNDVISGTNFARNLGFDTVHKNNRVYGDDVI